MLDFLNAQIGNYVKEHCQPEPELLQELNRETHLKVLKPRMLSGHVQGRFLSMISKLLEPKNILEIGTFTGYSTLCLAEGLAENGKILTIDSNPESLLIARKYFDRSPLGKKIQILEGEAQNLLMGLNQIFDLVFIDADKKNNRAYFDITLNMVRPGGLILVDNVLWSGKIVSKKPDRKSLEILRFNDYLHLHSQIESFIVPIRDGLFMIRKKINEI